MAQSNRKLNLLFDAFTPSHTHIRTRRDRRAPTHSQTHSYTARTWTSEVASDIYTHARALTHVLPYAATPRARRNWSLRLIVCLRPNGFVTRRWFMPHMDESCRTWTIYVAHRMNYVSHENWSLPLTVCLRPDRLSNMHEFCRTWISHVTHRMNYGTYRRWILHQSCFKLQTA